MLNFITHVTSFFSGYGYEFLGYNPADCSVFCNVSESANDIWPCKPLNSVNSTIFAVP